MDYEHFENYEFVEYNEVDYLFLMFNGCIFNECSSDCWKDEDKAYHKQCIAKLNTLVSKHAHYTCQMINSLNHYNLIDMYLNGQLTEKEMIYLLTTESSVDDEEEEIEGKIYDICIRLMLYSIANTQIEDLPPIFDTLDVYLKQQIVDMANEADRKDKLSRISHIRKFNDVLYEMRDEYFDYDRDTQEYMRIGITERLKRKLKQEQKRKQDEEDNYIYFMVDEHIVITDRYANVMNELIHRTSMFDGVDANDENDTDDDNTYDYGAYDNVFDD